MAAGRPRSSGIALWILAVIATAFFLRAASQLFIPITIAVLLSYALEPVVAWLARHHVPRLIGATTLLFAIIGLGAWGVYSLRDDVIAATEVLPKAAARIREIVSAQGDGPAANIQEAARQLEGGARAQSKEQRPAGTAGSGSAGGGQAEPMGSSAGSILFGFLQQGVSAALTLAGHLVVILFLVFFLLIAGSHFRARLIEVAGPSPEHRRNAASILDDINMQVQRFLLVRLVTGVIVAVATWTVLAWMGVPQAAVWGILAGVFNSIPYFGPVIVSGGLLVVGLLQGGLADGLKMAGAALVITSLEGWLLDPPLMGKAERMSALVVFIGVLVWTWIWGAWGTILAVPMLVIVKSVADHVARLRPVSRLMAP